MDMKITVGQNTKCLKLSFGILLRIDWYGQSGIYSEKKGIFFYQWTAVSGKF